MDYAPHSLPSPLWTSGPSFIVVPLLHTTMKGILDHLEEMAPTSFPPSKWEGILIYLARNDPNYPHT
jgi:hypothetical protein